MVSIQSEEIETYTIFSCCQRTPDFPGYKMIVISDVIALDIVTTIQDPLLLWIGPLRSKGTCLKTNIICLTES